MWAKETNSSPMNLNTSYNAIAYHTDEASRL